MYSPSLVLGSSNRVHLQRKTKLQILARDPSHFYLGGVSLLNAKIKIFEEIRNEKPSNSSNGFTATTIEQLSKAADNGVTAGYIREIQAVGFTNLSLDQIAKAADEKVHPLTHVK